MFCSGVFAVRFIKLLITTFPLYPNTHAAVALTFNDLCFNKTFSRERCDTIVPKAPPRWSPPSGELSTKSTEGFRRDFCLGKSHQNRFLLQPFRKSLLSSKALLNYRYSHSHNFNKSTIIILSTTCGFCHMSQLNVSAPQLFLLIRSIEHPLGLIIPSAC